MMRPNEWMNELMNEWMNKWMNEWMNEKLNSFGVFNKSLSDRPFTYRLSLSADYL